MRRTLLIIVAFIPAVLAFVIFRQSSSSQHRGVRRLETEGGKTPRDQDGDTVVFGSEGRGTFYVRSGEAVIDGRPQAYPAWYYHLGKWKRTAQDRVDIHDLIVVHNRRPETEDELDAVLDIRNDETAERRRAQLEQPLEAMPSIQARIRAGAGVAHGEGEIGESEHIELLQGVTAHLLPRSRVDPVTIRSDRADVHFAEDRLSKLVLNGSFRVERSDLRLEGQDLTLEDKSEALVIEDRPRIFFGRRAPSSGEEAWQCTIAGNGPLVLVPESKRDPAEDSGGVLARFDIDRGTLRLEGGVEIDLGDIRLFGDRLEGFFHTVTREDGNSRLELEKLILDGRFRMQAAGGVVAGRHAELLLTPDGGFETRVQGTPVRVRWNEGLPSALEATCAGDLRVSRPLPEAGEPDELKIGLVEDVQLVLDRSTFGKLTLCGETLDVDLDGVAAGTGPDAIAGASRTTRWEISQAVLAGPVTGRSESARLAGTLLRITRRYGETGLPLEDIGHLEGPAHVEWDGVPQRAGEAAAEIWRLDAREHIVVHRPASPLEASRSSARGDVVIRRRRGEEAKWIDELRCSEATLTTRPGSASPGSTRRASVVDHLLGEGRVEVRLEDGSTALGDRFEIDRDRSWSELRGTPARLSYVDAQGRGHQAQALSFELDGHAGRMVAEGSVKARMFFPGLMLTETLKREIDEAERELEEPPPLDVAWDLMCSKLTSVVTGRLPLPGAPRLEARGDAPGPTLREVDAEGEVMLMNPQQVVRADRVRYDFVTGHGWAEGTPVDVRAKKETPGGFVEDQIQAPRIVVRREWTLFEGSCTALLHVRPERDRRSLIGRPKEEEAYERLHVRSGKDILFRDGIAYFSGRTHVRRGDLEAGGLELDCDSAVVRLKTTPKAGRELEKIEAFGQVSFRWRDLKGEGDVLAFDHAERVVVLEAKEGRCRMTLRNITESAPVVVYDMARKTVTTYRTKGQVTRSSRDGR